MGFDPFALEYSTERICALKNNGIPVIKHNDSMTFDLIIVNQILEHVTEPIELLKDIYSKLNNNGVAFLSVPNCSKIENKLSRTNNIADEKELHRVLLDASVAAFQHVNFFNNRNFKTLIRNCGFEIIFRPFLETVNSENNIKSFVRAVAAPLLRTRFFVKKGL
jgi:2-polyprenyl-3-methyl-5-hydroxy-6-metoxy-1,4-benzoquinol methylase